MIDKEFLSLWETKDLSFGGCKCGSKCARTCKKQSRRNEDSKEEKALISQISEGFLSNVYEAKLGIGWLLRGRKNILPKAGILVDDFIKKLGLLKLINCYFSLVDIDFISQMTETDWNLQTIEQSYFGNIFCSIASVEPIYVSWGRLNLPSPQEATSITWDNTKDWMSASC